MSCISIGYCQHIAEEEKNDLKPFKRVTKNPPTVIAKTIAGRIFFTSDDRRLLDAGVAIERDDDTQNDDDALPATRIKHMSLDGYILRNGKLEAVWLNGVINKQDSHIQVRQGQQGEVVVSNLKSEQSITMRPGQKGNLDKGESFDLVPKNAIRLQKP